MFLNGILFTLVTVLPITLAINFENENRWDWLDFKPCPSKNISMVSPPSQCSNVQTPDDGVYYSVERFSEVKASYAAAFAVTGIANSTTTVVGLIGEGNQIYLVYLNMLDPSTGRYRS